MYLLAYFLLADVCSLFLSPRHNVLTCLGFVPGFKHNYYLGTNLPEYPVLFLFLREYVPRPRASRHVAHWTGHVLVHTTLLEDRTKEDGEAAGCCVFLKNGYFYGYLAHHDNHCGSLAPSLGNDRYLDRQAWVSRKNCSSPTGTGHS